MTTLLWLGVQSLGSLLTLKLKSTQPSSLPTMSDTLKTYRGARRLFHAVCLLFLTFSAREMLAAGEGKITGQVTNKATGYALEGAVVAVTGSGESTLTQRGGGFSLSVPTGTQKLQVSYTGLDATTVNVTVGEGQTVVQNVAMTSSIYTLDAVTVKGTREGNAAALTRQRNAINPKIVVAADAYGVPAANPGELIQRLPGVSVDIVGSEVRNIFLRGMTGDFVAFQVDGNQMATSAGTSAGRVLQIEQMGTGNIESVEVIKANTPDRDANAVAGYINLVTRRAYDTPGQFAQLTGGVLWRLRESDANPFQDKATSGLDLFGLRYSNAFSVLGGEKNLGIAFNFNRRRSSTTQDEIGAGLVATGTSELNNSDPANPKFPIWGTGDLFYPAIATNIGLNIDFKLGPKSYAYLHAVYNTNYQYQQFYRWDIISPSNFSPDSTSAFQTILPTANSTAHTYSSLFTKKSRNYSINPGISYRMFNDSATLDVDFSHSAAVVWYPNYHTTTANEVAPIGWSLDFRGRDQNHPVLTQTAGPSWSDSGNYNYTTDNKITWKAPDTLDVIRVDFKKELNTAAPAYIKVGAKYGMDDRASNPNFDYYTWTGPAGISPYVALSYKQAGGRYGPFPFANLPATGAVGDPLLSGYFVHTDANVYNAFVNSRASDLRLKEYLGAAYVMGSVNVGKLKLIGGVRAEKDDTSARSWTSNTVGTSFDSTLSLSDNMARANARFAGGQIRTKGSATDWFPSLQGTYEIGNGLILRGSATTSISRPPVANLVSATTVNPASMTVSAGNPDLKPYRSKNLDFSIEKYFEPVGQFSIGYFHKDVTNYIISKSTVLGSGTDNGFGGQYGGYTYLQPANLGFAKIDGWEINYQQQFSNLPGYFRGLGVQANYTYLKSTGNYGSAFPGGGSGGLLNLSPRQANYGLSYTLKGFDIRVLANVRAATPFIYNTANSANWVYHDARTILDLKARYTFGAYDVFLNVDNLTNEPPTTTRVYGRETFTLWQGVGFTMGLNFRL
jgi:iron complex outermembrane receptor protein